MGKDLADAFPAARDAFATVDEALDARVSQLCFEGPADELTLTHNAQPALLAHSAAVWAVLHAQVGAMVWAAAGHSLGEFTAYHAAGSLTLASAARLVRRRGELMFQTGVERPGTMAAIVGRLTEPAERICERATAEAGLVVPANYNDAEQIVVSGEVTGVERAMALAKEAGAKLTKRLTVSGAFHSPLMEPAVGGLAKAIDEAELSDPKFPVVSNVSAEPIRTASDAAPLLLRQLTSPVRWTDVVRTLAAAHPGALFVEMGPGNVLTKLVRRIVPEAETAACGTVAEVEHLLQRVA
jgi:[acyl-carrier-protein] S-malonyltransferase